MFRRQSSEGYVKNAGIRMLQINQNHPSATPLRARSTSVGTVALALAFALAKVFALALVPVLATTAAAARISSGDCDVLGAGLAAALADPNVKGHLAAHDHVLGSSVGQLREVAEDIVAAVIVC